MIVVVNRLRGGKLLMAKRGEHPAFHIQLYHMDRYKLVAVALVPALDPYLTVCKSAQAQGFCLALRGQRSLF